MTIPASVAVVLLLVVVVAQVKWANNFVRLYSRRTARPAEVEFPHVGVIMSLRGADPFLEDSLRGLLSLEYPSHEIRIIIDSQADPALVVVDRIRNELNAANVEVEFLELCQETSSLKNAALIQGIHGCSSECEVFAWLDSDTVPHVDWLKDLVEPLGDDSVGATCGVRWYAPPSNTIANYVRHIWNSGAVVQMVAFSIGWGGAFAIRKAIVQKLDLQDKWGRALVEDTLASNEVLQDGKCIAFVAECTMVNPEATSLKSCLSFLTRQLQAARYYHRAWRTVLWFGLFSGGVLLGNLSLILYGLFCDDLLCAALCGAGVATFGVVTGGLTQRSERCVNALIGDRAVGGSSLFLMIILAAPPAQIMHLIALVRACALRSATWRGIRYQIHSGLNMLRTNYVPYLSETDTPQHSL